MPRPDADQGTQPNGNGTDSGQLQASELLAGLIPLVVDRPELLRRLREIVSTESNCPEVAIYLGGTGDEDFRIATARHTKIGQLPEWMARSEIEPVTREATLPVLMGSGTGEAQAIILPIQDGGLVNGGILLVGLRLADLGGERLLMLENLAQEIGPLVGVANQHYVVQQTSVIDLDTGSYTFEFFNQRLTEELSRAKRSNETVSVVLVDLTEHQELERRTGYEVADQVLRQLAEGFDSVLRVSDVVARRGRTGFAILLPGSDPAGADMMVARLNQVAAKTRDSINQGSQSSAVISMISGLASYPVDGDDAASLLYAAEHRQLAARATSSRPA
jgi:diguanylate cyclase (GGDEF)-like protein